MPTIRKKVTLTTDGACSGNPGPGGWAALLRYGTHEKIISGHDSATTNNRMELMGVIEGLRTLKTPCDVTVVSDSKYIVEAMTKGWIESWQAKNWKKSDNKPVANVDLWQDLLAAAASHHIEWEWVKGHGNHADNNRVDRIARQEAQDAALDLAIKNDSSADDDKDAEDDGNEDDK